MGLFADLFKAMSDYGTNHKKHMVQQWEKQAERSKAQEPRPLTETQLTWQRLQQERAAQQQEQQAPLRASAAVCRTPAAAVASTPVYTITWHVRLSSLGNIPMPWEPSMQ